MRVFPIINNCSHQDRTSCLSGYLLTRCKLPWLAFIENDITVCHFLKVWGARCVFPEWVKLWQMLLFYGLHVQVMFCTCILKCMTKVFWGHHAALLADIAHWWCSTWQVKRPPRLLPSSHVKSCNLACACGVIGVTTCSISRSARAALHDPRWPTRRVQMTWKNRAVASLQVRGSRKILKA